MKVAIICLVGIGGVLAFSLFSLYSVVFWAWVSATPLNAAQRARAQYNANAWFLIFVGCLVTAVIMCVFWLLSRRIGRAASAPRSDRNGE